MRRHEESEQDGYRGPDQEEYQELIRIAMRKVRDRGDAEDIVQSLYIRLRRGAGRTGWKGAVRPYMRTAVLNAAKNFLRDKACEREKLEEFHRARRSGPAAARISDYDPEEARLALDVLTMLPREVVVLRDWSHKTLEECEEILRIPSKRISQLHHESLIRLEAYFALPEEERLVVRRNGPTSLERLGREEMERINAAKLAGGETSAKVKNLEPGDGEERGGPSVGPL